MSTASVTVVIPTFNRVDLLKRAVRSVLQQTWKDFELFISDNASSDDTANYCRSLDDSRLHYAPLPENIGAAANFTRSSRLGSAPYVALLQDDDLMLPDNLEKKIELLERRPDVAFVHSSFQFIDDNDQVFVETTAWMDHGAEGETFETGDEFIRRSIAGGCRADFSAAVIRRSSLEGIEFDPVDFPAVDMAVWLRLARRGAVAFLSDPLVAKRIHLASDSVSNGLFRFDTDRFRPQLGAVALLQEVKDRFLEDFGQEFADERQMRSSSRRFARTRLRKIVDDESGGNRKQALRLLWQASQIERTLLLDPATARFVMSTIAGKRARQLVLRARRVGRVH